MGRIKAEDEERSVMVSSYIYQHDHILEQVSEMLRKRTRLLRRNSKMTGNADNTIDGKDATSSEGMVLVVNNVENNVCEREACEVDAEAVAHSITVASAANSQNTSSETAKQVSFHSAAAAVAANEDRYCSSKQLSSDSGNVDDDADGNNVCDYEKTVESDVGSCDPREKDISLYGCTQVNHWDGSEEEDDGEDTPNKEIEGKLERVASIEEEMDIVHDPSVKVKTRNELDEILSSQSCAQEVGIDYTQAPPPDFSQQLERQDAEVSAIDAEGQ